MIGALLRGTLVEAALIGAAAVEAALTTEPAWPRIACVVIAVLALPARRRRPVAVLLVTATALAVAGAIIPVLISLYAVATRSSDRRLLAGCGLLAVAASLFSGADFDPPLGAVALAVGYAIITAAAPIALGQVVRRQRELRDVVCRQVGLIAAQAGTLQAGADDAATKGAAENIRRLSVDTLDEVRNTTHPVRTPATPMS